MCCLAVSEIYVSELAPTTELCCGEAWGCSEWLLIFQEGLLVSEKFFKKTSSAHTFTYKYINGCECLPGGTKY